MKGKQLQRDLPGERCDERADGIECGFAVVEAGDHGRTKNERRVRCRDAADVVENARVRRAGEGAVKCLVDALNVAHDEIEMRQQRCNRFPRHMRRGFDGGMDALRPQKRQQLRQKFRLQKRFAAGEGHAAAGFSAERGIAADLIEQAVGIDPAAGDLQRTGIAGFGAGAAADAVGGTPGGFNSRCLSG